MFWPLQVTRASSVLNLNKRVTDMQNIIPLKNAEAQTAEGQPKIRVVPKYPFNKVYDSRGHRLTGLWERNGVYYGQLRLPGKKCSRRPLVDEHNQRVRTVQEAAKAYYKLREGIDEGEMPVSRRVPPFSEYVKKYLAWVEDGKRKSEKTIVQERYMLNGWTKFLGQIRLNQITLPLIKDYESARLREGVSHRTVNLGVLVLGNLLKAARDDGWLRGKLPTERWERLDHKPKPRRFYTTAEIERLCAIAVQKDRDGEPKFKNGEMLADAIRFMKASGARVASALACHWEDVDWEKKLLHLHRKTKRNKHIWVDFNPELEKVLRDLFARRQPDSVFMFPGTRTDGSVGSLRRTFEMVRKEANLPGVGFHDLRHHFASCCVQSGTDFRTAAKWLGHSDNGVLLAKTYSHSCDVHAQQAAKRVCFNFAEPPSPNQNGQTPPN